MQRELPVIESIAHDFRFALRTLRRQSGWTAVAVLTLALGAHAAGDGDRSGDHDAGVVRGLQYRH